MRKGETTDRERMSVRMSWPEVVGWSAADAKAQIKSDRPDVTIEVLPWSTYAPPKYFNNLRVRVYVDTSYAGSPVVYVPVVG